MTGPPTSKKERHEAIRECFCRECGMIAPSWFHSDFILGRHGFTCVWCAFPRDVGAMGPKPTDREYLW